MPCSLLLSVSHPYFKHLYVSWLHSCCDPGCSVQGVGPKTEGAVGYVYPGSGDTQDNRPPLRRTAVEAAAGAPAASVPSGAADSTTAAAVAGVAAAVASELMAMEAGSINGPEGEESRQQAAAAQELEDEVSAAACRVCWGLAGACSRQQLPSRGRPGPAVGTGRGPWRHPHCAHAPAHDQNRCLPAPAGAAGGGP